MLYHGKEFKPSDSIKKERLLLSNASATALHFINGGSPFPSLCKRASSRTLLMLWRAKNCSLRIGR
jgi:hypothetical protein